MIKEITGDAIKSAISLRLRSGFATTSGIPPVTTYPTIYKEQIVQGFSLPCFHIRQVNVDQRHGLNNNFFRDYYMEVSYHVDQTADDLRKQLDAVGSKALEVLSSVPIVVTDDLTPVTLSLRGRDMGFQVIEEVMVLLVTYTIQAKSSLSSVTDMATLDLDQAIKD